MLLAAGLLCQSLKIPTENQSTELMILNTTVLQRGNAVHEQQLKKRTEELYSVLVHLYVSAALLPTISGLSLLWPNCIKKNAKVATLEQNQI